MPTAGFVGDFYLPIIAAANTSTAKSGKEQTSTVRIDILRSWHMLATVRGSTEQMRALTPNNCAYDVR